MKNLTKFLLIVAVLLGLLGGLAVRSHIASAQIYTTTYGGSVWFFSSEGGDPYDADEALGAPDSGNCTAGGMNSWFSSSGGGSQLIGINFATPLYPDYINIYQTYAPGTIIWIGLYTDQGNWYAYGGDADTTCGAAQHIFTLNLTNFTEKVVAIEIDLEEGAPGIADGWTGIDAVEMVGYTELIPVTDPVESDNSGLHYGFNGPEEVVYTAEAQAGDSIYVHAYCSDHTGSDGRDPYVRVLSPINRPVELWSMLNGTGDIVDNNGNVLGDDDSGPVPCGDGWSARFDFIAPEDGVYTFFVGVLHPNHDNLHSSHVQVDIHVESPGVALPLVELAAPENNTTDNGVGHHNHHAE